MDTLELARLQFAITTSLHFLFVALTLGLAPLLAIMQTRAVVTGRELDERMTRFWGQLYLINYGLGIVTGLVMEFQFGLAWSGLSRYAGTIFGAPLALETLLAFFIESTCLALWITGWHRLPAKLHLALIWLVTLTAYASMYWIVLANSFLQDPVGSQVEDGHLVLTDFPALLTNPHLLWALPHITGAALTTAAFLIIGVSAYHLFRRTPHNELFTRSLRFGVFTALIGTVVTFGSGHLGAPAVEHTQPGKFDHPAVVAPFTAMLGIGDLLMLFTVLALWPMLRRDKLARTRWLHPVLIALVPVPFATTILGWVTREVGRQPWLIYGRLRVADALSDTTAGTVRASLIAFAVVLGVIAVANYVLIARTAGRGPDHLLLGARPTEEAPVAGLSLLGGDR